MISGVHIAIDVSSKMSVALQLESKNCWAGMLCAPYEQLYVEIGKYCSASSQRWSLPRLLRADYMAL